jgi:hypothetical protein
LAEEVLEDAAAALGAVEELRRQKLKIATAIRNGQG